MATDQIQIRRIGTSALVVPVRGTSPLIVHKFSEKAKRQMLDAMQGRKTPKQPKNPEAEYQSAFYMLDDGTYGFPSVAFKASMVAACRFFGKDLPMTKARAALFVGGIFSEKAGQQLVMIDGTPHMREDVVRVGMGGTDLRYRPEFTRWKASLSVVYVSSMLTSDSVLSLIEAAGLGVGVGEWRPEKNGDFGQFEIDTDREVMEVAAG